MRTWRRVGFRMTCGNCRKSIPKGVWWLEIAIPTVSLVRCRCQECAKRGWNEEPPMDAPGSSEVRP